MFWHITALRFRNSLVLKFIFDLSPFYVEELVGEKKTFLFALACLSRLPQEFQSEAICQNYVEPQEKEEPPPTPKCSHPSFSLSFH